MLGEHLYKTNAEIAYTDGYSDVVDGLLQLASTMAVLVFAIYPHVASRLGTQVP